MRGAGDPILGETVSRREVARNEVHFISRRSDYHDFRMQCFKPCNIRLKALNLSLRCH